ncbi:MAG: hypothetical protein P8X95_17250 [Anaerolineales bacterium]
MHAFNLVRTMLLSMLALSRSSRRIPMRRESHALSVGENVEYLTA